MGSVFDIPYQELRQWGPGELVDHDKLNQPVDALNSLRRVGVNPPTQVIAPVRPAAVRLVASVTSETVEFRFRAMHGDFIMAVRENGDEDSLTVIAKPWMLRRSPFDGVANPRRGIEYAYVNGAERKASPVGIGFVEETQIVHDSYLVDDLIYAVKVAGNVSGIDTENVVEFVEWLDVNVDSRAWFKRRDVIVPP